jgi:uncharacterized lipoprotein YmbA
MRTTMTRRRSLLAGCLLPALLCACAATQPTRFYTLTTATEPTVASRTDKGLVVGLGPVTLPPYLDRPDIVTRQGANQMRLPDVYRWSEPLQPLMTRIMGEDLYALLGANDVIPLPQRGDLRLDRAIEVDVGRFDATQAGEVTLDARWRIYGGDEQRLITSGRSILTEPSAPVPDYDAIVAAMSKVVGRLSQEIATAVAGKAPVPGPTPKRVRRS